MAKKTNKAAAKKTVAKTKKKPAAKKPVKKTNEEIKADRQAKLISKHSKKQANGTVECDLIWIDGVLCHKATSKPAK